MAKWVRAEWQLYLVIVLVPVGAGIAVDAVLGPWLGLAALLVVFAVVTRVVVTRFPDFLGARNRERR